MAGVVLPGDANMETFYVLMEQGWDYNDEVYFSSEGGHPTKVFTDKEKAEAEANRLSMVDFKRLILSGEIREYAYGLDEILSAEATEEDTLYEEGIFMTLFGKPAEEWWDSFEYRSRATIQGEPTDEQWQKLFSCFNFNFYNVVTVEKG